MRHFNSTVKPQSFHFIQVLLSLVSYVKTNHKYLVVQCLVQGHLDMWTEGANEQPTLHLMADTLRHLSYSFPICCPNVNKRSSSTKMKNTGLDPAITPEYIYVMLCFTVVYIIKARLKQAYTMNYNQMIKCTFSSFIYSDSHIEMQERQHTQAHTNNIRNKH